MHVYIFLKVTANEIIFPIHGIYFLFCLQTKLFQFFTGPKVLINAEKIIHFQCVPIAKT